MNFKKRVNGSWTDTPHYIHNTSTDTITTLPAVIHPTGTTATVGLKGNTIQNGTPTPDSPIMPQGTGDRTENLFDVTGAQSGYITADGTITSGHDNLMYTDYIPIPDNVEYITQSYGSFPTAMNAPAMVFYDVNKSYISGEAFANLYEKTFAVPNNAKYIRTCYRTTMSWIMLNTGSQPLPYEPYGYKIPISINNVITDIYIGDNPLRKSLDGTAYDTLAADGTLTRRVDSDGSVLPTPIVTQVTMPTFTTTPGANTLDVLTTVPPSEVTATFNGWHPVSSAHERDNGAWT